METKLHTEKGIVPKNYLQRISGFAYTDNFMHWHV
jgi:hypothetical protein